MARLEPLKKANLDGKWEDWVSVVCVPESCYLVIVLCHVTAAIDLSSQFHHYFLSVVF